MNLGLYGGVSLLSATLALLATGYWGGSAPVRRRDDARPIFADAPRRYEFREGYMISPIDPDDAFLPQDVDRSAALADLARGLAPLNPDLPARITTLARRGEAFVLSGSFGSDALSIAGRAEGDRLVITLGPSEVGTGRQVIDGPVLKALQAEAEDMRHALDLGRAVIWTLDDQGRVIWANGPYLALVERLSGAEGGPLPWPVPHLFADQLDPMPEPGSLRRCRLTLPDGDAMDSIATADGGLWFEIAVQRQGQAIMCCATPIDRLVAAETSLRNFVQALSKTFAHLPIGLAIFDRRRELMLFNPALVTLSTLSPEFLSRRPGLVAFLDALRDRQRMPEPKNYRGWRDEIARLEQRAEEGTYQELWTLPGGQSFRVIGRPHPDGAVAFMFEDITSEVMLTRSFRGELDLYHSVFDDLPGAMAIFSGEGRLVQANKGYGALWSVEPDQQIGVLSITEATRLWQAGCVPTGIWGDIRQFSAHKTDRSSWAEDITLRDGRRLILRVAPLAGGAMSIRFLDPDADAATGIARFTRAARPLPASGLHEVAEDQVPFQGRRLSGD